MHAKLTRPIRYRDQVGDSGPEYPAGSIVPVIPAKGQPRTGQHIRLWIDTPELRADPFGLGLWDGDFEIC